MENSENNVLSDQTVVKEYQIPELVDLNSVAGASGLNLCISGSGNGSSCGSGTSGPIT